jgi:hypothetical protein
MPRSLRPFRRGGPAVAGLVALAALCACTPMRVAEDTPSSVSIRYDGVVATLDDATAEANRLCGTHGKVAHLRSTDMKAALEHFAHFDCVNG